MRESLRDIETCLRAQSHKLPHMGIINGVSRNTLANANKMRDWRIYADFAQRLIHTARNLYAGQDHELDLDNTGVKCRRIYSRKVDRSTGVVCDQTVKLCGTNSSDKYPDTLRRISYQDLERGKKLVFLTNNTQLPALTIAEMYKSRWQVELFFKWIKQHLRIKSFYGVSENAVKSQLWIAVSVYVLCAIIKKRLHLEQTLYTILQTLSLTLFEKTPLFQLLSQTLYTTEPTESPNQLILL